MSEGERRRHHRASLRLVIRKTRGHPQLSACATLWTSNVSAGGMYFQAFCQPEEGTEISFELTVPPGEGYSAGEGTIRGSGKIVRTHDLEEDLSGIAVQFTQPLSLAF